MHGKTVKNSAISRERSCWMVKCVTVCGICICCTC